MCTASQNIIFLSRIHPGFKDILGEQFTTQQNEAKDSIIRQATEDTICAFTSAALVCQSFTICAFTSAALVNWLSTICAFTSAALVCDHIDRLLFYFYQSVVSTLYPSITSTVCYRSVVSTLLLAHLLVLH